MNPDTRRFSRRSRWLAAMVLVVAAGAAVFAFGDRAVLSDIGKTEWLVTHAREILRVAEQGEGWAEVSSRS